MPYVLTTAPTGQTADAPPHPAAAEGASPSGRLLTLVRNLILFGQQLIASLQASPAPDVLHDLSIRFGTINVTLILARITRGFMRAAALEQRLIRGARQIDAPAQPARTGSTRKTAAARGTRPMPPRPEDDDAALLARLPTEQDIAQEVRRGRIGRVIEQICHDLGITASHPLWRELQSALLRHGGNMARFVTAMFHRTMTVARRMAEAADGAWIIPPPPGWTIAIGPP